MLAAGLQQARGLVDWQQLAGRRASAPRASCAWPSRAGRRAARRRQAALGRACRARRRRRRAGATLQLQRLRAGRATALGDRQRDRARLRAPARARRAARRHAPRRSPQPCAAGLGALGRRRHAAARWSSRRSTSRGGAQQLLQAEQRRARRHAPGSSPRPRWATTSGCRWFTEPCGLDDAAVLRVGSPFDYARAGRGCTCRASFPKPNDPGHSAAVARLAARCARALGGRTLVLTTTLRALRAIGDALQRRVRGAWRRRSRCWCRASVPKRALMRALPRRRSRAAGCVLVARASFWEGVDVPGDALQLVVIDKLPFPPPGDPLVRGARRSAWRRRAAAPFNDYFVAEAAVALKQGAGRLIRRETDRGLLVVCDTRLASMGYGRRLLAALPPMRGWQRGRGARLAGDAARTAPAVGRGRSTRASTTGLAWR